MLDTGGQQLFSNGFLSAVSFGVGIAALLWVFRRTIFIQRRRRRDDKRSRKEQSAQAHQMIEEIESRNRMQAYNRAIKIKRGQLPDVQQRQALRDISARQRRPGGE